MSVLWASLVAPAADAGAGLAPGDRVTVFVQPSQGGDYHAGRLALRGVASSVSWSSDRLGGGSREIPFAALRRRLFSAGQPAPIGVLATTRGRVATVRLSHPRYQARSHMLTYHVQRVGKQRLPRRFGAASLTILGEAAGFTGAPQGRLGSSFGNACTTTVVNATGYSIQTVSSSKWDTDSWDNGSPPPADFGLGTGVFWWWGSEGGAFHGCSNTSVWRLYGGASGTFTFQTSYPWTGSKTITCTSSNPAFRCLQVSLSGGTVTWSIGPNPG